MIIYKTTNLINGKIYIGKDTRNRSNYFGSGKLLNLSIKKYGKENFKKEILETCITEKKLNEREIYWISKFNSQDKTIGYNIADGGQGGDCMTNHPNKIEIYKKVGEGNKGKIISDVHKEAISKANTGKVLSKEHRDKIRQARIGVVLTEETKNKISDFNKGKKLSDETKSKISEYRKGKHHSLEAIEKMKNRVVSEETKKTLSLINKGRQQNNPTHKRYWFEKYGDNGLEMYNKFINKEIDKFGNKTVKPTK